LRVGGAKWIPINYVQFAMRDLKVDELSDEFGQYLIYLKCECGHIHRCHPKTLANVAGWDARLGDIVKRLRCSKCNQKKCTARVVEDVRPRGYKSH